MLYVTYPFLAISGLLFMGFAFGGAFIDSFTIENRTRSTITVTPIGTRGPEGRKGYLPVAIGWLPLPALPVLRAEYRLEPGESVKVSYDMDDINFSEIVVNAGQGARLALVVDPDPITDQYHGPLQSTYVIDDLANLAAASPAVLAAADSAKRQWVACLVFNSILFGPWLAYAALKLALRRLHMKSTAFCD
jgi:hypothetical protein